MAAPTGRMTTADLVKEVALLLGIPWYGASGGEHANVPMNAHDLDLCLRIVNDGIRKFIASPPKRGWQWQKRKMQVTLDVEGDAANSIDSNPGRYLLDAAFGGVVLGPISYEKETSHGGSISWVHESNIRKHSENEVSTTYPYWAAITPYANGQWELDVYPDPVAADVVEFMYLVHFDKLSMESGVATGGSAITLVDSALANKYANDFFNGGTLVIVGGTGKFQTATITDYVSSTGTFTFTALSGASTPDTTSYYYALPSTDTHPVGHQFDEAIKRACFAEAAEQVEDVADFHSLKFDQLYIRQAHQLDAASAPRKLGSMNVGYGQSVSEYTDGEVTNNES